MEPANCRRINFSVTGFEQLAYCPVTTWEQCHRPLHHLPQSKPWIPPWIPNWRGKNVLLSFIFVLYLSFAFSNRFSDFLALALKKYACEWLICFTIVVPEGRNRIWLLKNMLMEVGLEITHKVKTLFHGYLFPSFLFRISIKNFIFLSFIST